MPPYRLEAPPQKTELETFPPPAPIFAATSFWIVDDLPADYKAMLIDTIRAASGTVVADMMSCQYILANPPYANEPWHVEFLKLSSERDPEHDPIPAIRPYYWVHDCLLSNPPRILFASDVHKKAIFAQADNKGRRTPVRAYISINITADQPEDNGSGSMVALNIERDILRHGGVRVILRARSDILILDPNTRQGAEYVKAAKPHQTVRKREWVEQMVQSKTPMGRDVVSSAIIAKSLVQMDYKAKPARQDFTREDDDYIARYHAYKAPDLKKLKSLTFYKELLDGRKPGNAWAHRHTAESWRERVRKREAFFLPVLHKYINAGLDEHLRTEEERQKAADEDRRRMTISKGKDQGTAEGTQNRAHGEPRGGASPVTANDEQQDERRKSGSKRKADHVAARSLASAFGADLEASEGIVDEADDRANLQKRQKLASVARNPTPPGQDTPSTAAALHPSRTVTAQRLTVENVRAAAASPSPVTTSYHADEMQVDAAAHVDAGPSAEANMTASKETGTIEPAALLLGHAGPRRLEQVEAFTDEWESPPVMPPGPIVTTAQDDGNMGSETISESKSMERDTADQSKALDEEEVVGYIVMPEQQAPGNHKGETSQNLANDVDNEGEDSDAPIERDIAAGNAALLRLAGHRAPALVEESVAVQVLVERTVTARTGLDIDQQEDFVGETQAGRSAGLAITPPTAVRDDRLELATSDAEAESMSRGSDDDEDDPADTLDVAAHNFFTARLPSLVPSAPAEDLPARKRLSMGLPLQPVGRKVLEEQIRAARGRSLDGSSSRILGSKRHNLDAKPLPERSRTPSSAEGFARSSQHDDRRQQIRTTPFGNERLNQPQRDAAFDTPRAQQSSTLHGPAKGTPKPDVLMALTQKLCRKFGITATTMLDALKAMRADGTPITVDTIEEALERYTANL